MEKMDWSKVSAGSSKTYTPNSHSCHRRAARETCCPAEVWGYTGNEKSQKQVLTLRKISCSASLQHLINHKKFIAVYTPVPETLSPN